jgi:GntR family transcriptional regulator, rspAB operon transcriptional repressor
LGVATSKAASLSRKSGAQATDVARNSDSLGAEAYEWIVRAITTFAIPTNSQLSENKLAAQLNISRTPIREALKRLETEGLVRRDESGRFIVAMLTHKDVDDALDFLTICDTYIFSAAAKNISKDDARTLADCAKEMLLAGKSGDQAAWSKADGVFHELVMTSSNNPIVSEAARMTRRRIQRFWARSSAAGKNLASCSQEHVDIANAIAVNDVKKIGVAVGEHIAHLRTHMHEIIDAAAPFLGVAQ